MESLDKEEKPEVEEEEKPISSKEDMGENDLDPIRQLKEQR